MSLIQELHDLCIEKNISIATAESCTAGLIASEISSFSGASSFFKGGIITYQNNIKINELGVLASTINRNTEVCADVVEQMAKSVRGRFLSDFSIASSGYAGPSGGTELNPIGTVFIAISSSKKIISRRFLFSGDRKSIVKQAVNSSIDLLLNELKKQL